MGKEGGMSQHTELIHWTPASAKPDSDITVVCWRAAEQEWFSGWWDDGAGAWFDAATGGVVEGVTHWAHVQGPLP